MKIEKTAEKLLQSIKKSTCSFTTASHAMERLENHGFEEISMQDEWVISEGGKYFLNIYDSGVLAFTVGSRIGGMLKIAAAHTDHPCLYLKPNPEMIVKGYGKVNVEIYGGAILNTWLDRPLSVAGKVALKSDDAFHPVKRLVDFQRPLFTIPNLAIHLNRNINKGIELNRQTDMQPVCAMLEENLNKNEFFMDYLAEELSVEKTDILDYELYVYDAEEGCVLGLDNDFISSPRLDNITSVEACIEGILHSHPEEGIHMIALFDNEEIGSRTKQGADSELLSMLLEKLYLSLDQTRESYINAVLGGFLLSVDVAHGFHPNKPEKSDPTNINLLNGGIVIKRSSSQSYATDSESIAMIEQLCENSEIPYQTYAVRSDGTTGSTLGTIANKYLPMRSADIGVPVLAMHSAREMMGIKDQAYLEELLKNYFA
ncbi:MAG: M18 family aminopeptidase [Lachnospiraceae bacterium]|nr:M18 family aminopeptidase [Lachnospiraceae bacterium]